MGETDTMLWAQAVCRLVFEPLAVVHDGVVVEANDGAERLFDQTPLRGASAELIMPVAVAEQQAGPEVAGWDLRRPDPSECRIRTASGELRDVRWRSVPVGVLTVHVFDPMHAVARPQLDQDPFAQLERAGHRIAALETGLRNISWELQTLGVDGPSVDNSGPTVSPEQLRNLSPREREVLRSFLDGCSVAVSARLLHVSEHTVRSHLKSVYRKLGVRSQTELLRSMRRIAAHEPTVDGSDGTHLTLP